MSWWHNAPNCTNVRGRETLFPRSPAISAESEEIWQVAWGAFYADEAVERDQPYSEDFHEELYEDEASYAPEELDPRRRRRWN
jgi:hypothetical protein